MVNELKHATVGTSMTQAEFEAVGLHVCDSQATGDLIYASSSSQLVRRGIGSAGQLLCTYDGLPAWSSAEALTPFFLGDEANTKMTQGLTINQGAADDEIFALKSSDIAHGCTTVAETDTYFLIKKVAGDTGGAVLRSFTEAAAATCSTYEYSAIVGPALDTTKSTSGRAVFEFSASAISGTGLGNVTANGNILSARARLGGTTTTIAIIDSDGDLWLNGGITGTTLTMSGASDVGTSCEADAYTVGGVSGVDFGPGAITNLTIVKGIVTAAS